MDPGNTTFWWNVLAMFYGGALGDALGVPFEFRHSRPLSDYHGKLEYRPMMKSRQGTRYGVVGSVSDDTDMSIALARSIIQNGGVYSRSKAILQYIEWANSKPMGMGHNTRKLFTTIKFKAKSAINTYEAHYAKRFNPALKDGISKKDAQSNGSLMRCAALALSPGTNYKNVVDDVNLTNPNVINRECGVIYVKILRELLFGELGVDPLETAKQPKIQEAIRQAKNKEVRDVRSIGKGWVVHAFYCAVYCLLNFEDYASAIDWVIRLGGDTDTNAAIAGSLMGAKVGYPMLTDPEVEPNLVLLLSADPDQGEYPRPEKYHPLQYNDIVLSFGELLPEVHVQNENMKNVVFYYRQGFIPVLYTQLGDTAEYHAYFFLDDETLAVVDVVRQEEGVYDVLEIVVDAYHTKKAIQSLQNNPKDLPIIFEGTPAPLFAAYRFLTLFTEALTERALDVMHADVRLFDPADRNYDVLYGHDFFLINE
uniref:ADP-ribosylglycohydrolase n=1 Tax=Pithovirus LCPAC304 TaxID=2506594 RepID=A0A481Z9I2_9VIRU|nr:MAG: ADP-ribosylglycohydrolase [Pithovirus LCPAC304]